MAREVINRKGGAGEGAGSASEVITAEESSNLQNPPPPWDALRDPDLKLPPRPRSDPYSPALLRRRSARRLCRSAALCANPAPNGAIRAKPHRCRRATRGSPEECPHLACLRLRYWCTKRVP